MAARMTYFRENSIESIRQTNHDYTGSFQRTLPNEPKSYTNVEKPPVPLKINVDFRLCSLTEKNVIAGPYKTFSKRCINEK